MDDIIASPATSPSPASLPSSPLSSCSIPSSPLSMLSRSPSLPSSPGLLALDSSNDPSKRYPSPSASSQSGGASPRKFVHDSQTSQGFRGSKSVHRDRRERDDRDVDGPPPAKRRRVQQPARRPRMTRHIDMNQPTNAESEEELKYLLRALRKKKKIVVIAGAGISVSAGIPDFRSSTGLFTTLRGQHGLRGSGKHLFDASVYKHDSSTTSFHSMVRELAHMTETAKPTPFHHMLASIAQEGRLMRLYSQNVDCIDTKMAPLATNVPLNAKGPWPATIQLHGGLAKMVCSKCGQLADFDGSLFEGPEPPPCPSCTALDEVRTSVAGKRSHGIGRLRPRIVLYNEYNPDEEAIGNVSKADLRRGADAVIVVGTSLKIPGVRRLVKELCQVTRSRRDGFTAWINVDAEPQGAEFKDCWDLVVRGSSDDVARLVALPRWDDQDVGSPSGWNVTGDEDLGLEKLEVVLEDKSSSSPLKAIKDEEESADKNENTRKQSTLAKQKASQKPSSTLSLPTSSPIGSMPTPISSPKPARKRLPDKPTQGAARQSKLPFQQVKKADIKTEKDAKEPKVAKTPDLEAKAALKNKSEMQPAPQNNSLLTDKPAAKKPQQPRKPRQPTKSKPKKEDVTKNRPLAFRATKNVLDPAAKKRKPLPTARSPPQHAGNKVENHDASILSSDVSDLSSPPDSIKRQFSADLLKLPSLRDSDDARTGSPSRGKMGSYAEETFRVLDSKLQDLPPPPPFSLNQDLGRPSTPPATSEGRRASDAAETISPLSVPRGMGTLIN